MKVEFTNKIETENWRDIRIAVRERVDNLDEDQLSDDKKEILYKLQTQERPVFGLRDYVLLLEMAAETKKMWKAGEMLKVYFFGGQDARTQRVLEYASIWSHHCSIRFQATSNIDEAKIRVAFHTPSSWSYIGTDALRVPVNEPTINFGWLEDTLSDQDYKQVVLHEFGHVLGLIHEHQSPAVKMDWNRPYVYWYFNFHHKWTSADVDRNIFQEFEENSTQYSSLDKESIMGYHIPPQFTNSGQEFPKNYELSDMDKHYIGQLYPLILHS